MPSGFLSPKQVKALKPFVEGRTVHDLGAGDLILANQLWDMGAVRVYAIDKSQMPDTAKPGVTPIVSYFSQYEGPFDKADRHEVIDTAFVSWPVNWPEEGLVKLVSRSNFIIYLGKNTDGAACGDIRLFNVLVKREVLAHVPEYRNTLIVYGVLEVERDLLPEERAACDPGRLYSYAEAHALNAEKLRAERDAAYAEIKQLKAALKEKRRAHP
jgi:hypothetical protein